MCPSFSCMYVKLVSLKHKYTISFEINRIIIYIARCQQSHQAYTYPIVTYIVICKDWTELCNDKALFCHTAMCLFYRTATRDMMDNLATIQHGHIHGSDTIKPKQTANMSQDTFCLILNSIFTNIR